MARESEADVHSIAVCVGSACVARKSKRLRSRLKKLVRKRGVEKAIKVKKCGCLGRCGDGPTVELRPGRKRISRVKPRKARKLLKKVLAGRI